MLLTFINIILNFCAYFFPDCSKDLAAGGFFQKDADVFCGDCYQKKFGTKCHACGKFVEGEVLTALGNHYHHECFACNKCK